MRILAFFLFSLISISISFAQGYVIDHYHVDIDILPDGRVQIGERIDVDFKEERRGIIRDIPLKYKNASASQGSAIIIDEIDVVGEPFLEMREGNRVKIRIGSPDKKLTGKKSYQINYTVLGAIEQFGQTAEFPWNIIGDQWDTAIKGASANIKLPFPIESGENDMLLYIGNREMSIEKIEHELNRNSLRLNFPDALKARQGISMALRFKKHNFPIQHVPAAVLSDEFYVPRVDIDLTIDEHGEVMVNEHYRILPKTNMSKVTRSLPVVSQPSDTWNSVYRKPDLAAASWNGTSTTVKAARLGDSHTYEITLGAMKPGKPGRLQFNYVMIGSMASSDNVVSGIFDLGTFLNKVAIDTIDVTYNLPPGVDLMQDPEMEGFIAQKLGLHQYTFIRKSFMTGPMYQRVEFKSFNSVRLAYPKESMYDRLLIESFQLNIKSNAAGELNIEQSVLLKDASPEDGITYVLGKSFNTKSFPYQVYDDVLLSQQARANISQDDLHPDYKLATNRNYNTARLNKHITESRFYATYHMPVLRAEEGIVVPIYSVPGAPIDFIEVDVVDHQGNLIADFVQSNYFMGTDKKKIDVFFHEGYHYVYLPLQTTAVFTTSFMTRWKNRIVSNWQLIIALLAAAIFYALWYFFGRDRHFDGSSHAHPPDYMTPAEAGYLWDGKLHGRDLISLIYHWAARDLIAIEEVEQVGEESQYYLEKLNDLPVDAFQYEQLLYNKIFADSSGKVKVASLKNSLYKTMAEANKSLKKEFEKKHLYEPFTRGIGTLFVVLGFLLFGIGLVLLGFGWGSGDFSWALPTLIVAMSSLFFGYYLPKKTALGSRYFIALQKFNKFIDDAPPEEVASLYEKDSKYFQNTLAYAIVLGKAKKWAERFSGLMTAPPSYYRGGDGSDFSSVLFTDRVIRGMHSMEKDFYSMPAPAVNTSTYSGGRSSSFGGGGGFSGGGGFGGGGGSSW